MARLARPFLITSARSEPAAVLACPGRSAAWSSVGVPAVGADVRRRVLSGGEDGTVPKSTGVVVSSHGERSIDPADVLDLFAAVGWWPERTRAQLAAVIQSAPAVGAWSGDRLVGFARAVTDGMFRAYLEDVVLAPDLRGEGIGQLLVTRLLEFLPPTAVTSLFCSPALTRFYAETGFRATSQVVMHRPPNA